MYIPFSLLLCPNLVSTEWLSGYGNSRHSRGRSSNPFAQYYSMAVKALYYYDYFLTLSDEVTVAFDPFYNHLTAV